MSSDDWLMPACELSDTQPSTAALVAEYQRDAYEHELDQNPLGSLWRRQQAAKLRGRTYIPTADEAKAARPKAKGVSYEW